MKNQRGITLIALVITIILLIILVAISMSAIIGDNGIMTNATKAIEATGEAGAKEAFEIALAGAETQYNYAETQTNTGLVASEYITIGMIREGLGSNY